ncbi:unnamed protein product [Caenorhabditis brenneri]
MLSLTLLLASIAVLAYSYPSSYPYSQQYGNYDQQYSPQSQYYPSSGQRGYQNGGNQGYQGMQGGMPGSYQDYQGGNQGYGGYQGGQGGYGQGGYQGYQGMQGNQGGYPSRYRGGSSDSSSYSPFMDLTNYYGSQGVPQYYGYPSSASYSMTPYYQNQNYNMQQQQYSTPSQSSWNPMYYGNGYGNGDRYGYQSQQSQQSSMNIRPFQSSWGSSNGWGQPYQFTKVNAQVTDDNDNMDGSGMDSSEQTSSPANTDDSQMITSDD